MNKVKRYVLAVLLIACLIEITCTITSIPWWSFVIPCIVSGMLFPFKKLGLSPFSIGLISGFTVWSISFLYYNYRFGVGALEKIALMFDSSIWFIVIASAFIGGILSGLAVYTGNKILVRNRWRK